MSPLSPTSPASRLHGAVALLGVIALLAASGLAFAMPWLPPRPVSDALERYAPLRDGDAWLMRTTGPGGDTRSWTSGTVELLPATRVLATQLRQAQSEAVRAFYGTSEEPADIELTLARLGATGAQVVRLDERELGVTGLVSDSVAIGLRTPEGDFTLGLYRPDTDQDLIFAPALPELPATIEPGAAWEARGVFAGQLDYIFTGEVLARGPYSGAAGSFEDCVQTETRLTLAYDRQTVDEIRSRAWRCAGVGGVVSEHLAPDGAVMTRTELVSATGFEREVAFQQLPQSPSSPAPTTETSDDPADWELSRHARLLPTDTSSSSAFAPVWVPTEPPLLLAAAIDGGLVALDPDDPTGPAKWRFRAGGTFFGQPAYDPASGRIFAGASDKRLYALDPRGLYLWSFAAEDNIATRPAVADGVVLFGSEDRAIYGVDARTGRLAWERPFATSGPVVSSPAIASGVALIGSDDGQVYGLDPATGEELWDEPFAAEDAIEAPVVVAGGLAYVASRDGQVYGLDPASGEAVWSGRAGGPLRTAPAVGQGRVFVVDEFGSLKALDLESGRRLWVSPEAEYAGPPLLVGAERGRPALVLAREDGLVELLDLDGRRVRAWSALETASPAEDQPTLKHGPTVGGGAVWLADDNGVVLRLGEPLAGPRSLEVAWYRAGVEPPFDGEAGSGMYYTPAEYGGRAVVLDSGGSIYLVDPVNGRAVRVGRREAGGLPVFAPEPVVAGDTLLLSGGTSLEAVDLRDGRALWSFAAPDGQRPMHPPAVEGGAVLWAVGSVGDVSDPGTLYAIDLADGAVRWEAELGGSYSAGSVMVRGGRVYTSAPAAAFELASGQELWRADLPGPALGGGVLSVSGDTLYAGWATDDGGGVAAIDLADGAVRWEVETGGLPGFAERVWLSDGRVIAPSFEGPIVALDSRDGAELWRAAPGRRVGAVTVADGRVWQLNADSHVAVLDARSGELVGFYGGLDANLEINGQVAARPALLGGRVIIPLAGSLIAFEVE
jgi:outer membrane protein assembly factor BamB